MDITGNKVVLREIVEQDKEMLLNLIEDSKSGKATGGYGTFVSYEHQMEWFRSNQNRGLHYIIADREAPLAGLGMIALSNIDMGGKSGELYIKLMKSFRQKGYGQDAVTALVSYAFGKMGLSHIYSSILDDNTASRRLFEKCGFRQEEGGKSRTREGGYERYVHFYGISNKSMI